MSSAPHIDHPGRAALADALKELEKLAGYGTGTPKRSRAQAVSAANRGSTAAPTSLNTKTVGDWFTIGRVPGDFEVLWRLVSVLLDWSESPARRPTEQAAQRQAKKRLWKQLWEQAKLPSPRPAQRSPHPLRTWGQVIAETDPVTGLEVHRAIDSHDGSQECSDLPLYVERPHDTLVRRYFDSAMQGSSQLLVLVGDSSTGKTRALWEAVRRLPEGWRVWRPSGASELLSALTGTEPLSRTVLWLNEMQRYLTKDTHQLVVEALDTLISTLSRGPVLVAGTLWPRDHRDLTCEPASPAAKLLKDRHIRIPDTFDETSLQRLAETSQRDPRLAEALAQGNDTITQYLAGGPALLDRYNTSTEVQALVNAAVDAARLGYTQDVTEQFLHSAAWSLIPETYRRRQKPDWHTRWFPQALADAAQDCRGVPGPLTTDPPGPDQPPTAPRTYRLADYLRQRITPHRALLCPPEAWWQAAADHLTAPTYLLTLSHAAASRARHRMSAVLAQQALTLDPATPGYRHLVALHLRAGHQSKAQDIARQALQAGDPTAATALAQHLRADGRLQDAISLLRQAAELGSEEAWADLAVTLLAAGEIDAAVEASDHVHDYHLNNFASALTDAGHWDRHLPIARRLAADRQFSALLSHAHRLHETGERRRTIALLAETGRMKASAAYETLAFLLEDSGAPRAAEEAGRRAASECRYGKALKRLSLRREREGDLNGSANALRVLGSCPGWEWWLLAAADEYLQTGDASAALQTTDQAIAAGMPQGWVLRAYISTLTSNKEETEFAIAQATASQDGESHHMLGDYHRELDETEKADAAYRRAIELGCSDAWDDWAALWHDAGDTNRRDVIVSQASRRRTDICVT
ncbi:tetratricopeptide repeat protein [Streptomyces sp. NBC_01207]|uniref:tetratricopeptide repeat protein n=1 Tax=Streptomyces sp. NBC_01207 TaxID=2903772 RepID=UPI002E0DD1CF|nr:hypothetical protein OG457_46250 [Streptomyces sp. NBC_01207]